MELIEVTSKKQKSTNKNSISITDNVRKQRGNVDGSAMFPATPSKLNLPSDYTKWLADLKTNIAKTRLKVVLTSNAAMVLLYWDIGKRILDKQEHEGWGAKIIDRLALDLRNAFPDMKGFSPRNLKYMRAFANAWPKLEIVQEALAQLPWYHNIALLEKLKSSEDRLWYAKKAYEYGWSHNILSMQIEAKIHLRLGKSQNNFPATLPATDSDMAVQVFKDPYLFDFLGTDAPRREAELEHGLKQLVNASICKIAVGFGQI